MQQSPQALLVLNFPGKCKSVLQSLCALQSQYIYSRPLSRSTTTTIGLNIILWPPVAFFVLLQAWHQVCPSSQDGLA